MTDEQPAQLSAGAATTGLGSFLLMGSAISLYGPALPALGQVFAVSPATAGLIVSAHSFGALLGVLSALPLAGSPLARWRVGVAVALLGLGALTIALARPWAVALLGATVLGSGYGALTLGLNARFAVGFGRRSPAMVNLLNAVFGIGAIGGPLLVRAVAPDVRLPFVVLAALALLLVPWAARLDDRLPPLPPAAATNAGRQRWTLAGFSLLLALGVGLESSSTGWSATYLVSQGLTPAAAANIAAAFFAVFTLSRLVAVPLSVRVAPRWLVLAAQAAALALLALAHRAAVAPVALAALGGAVALVFPNTFLWLTQRVRTVPNAATIMLIAALIGGTIIPALISRLVSAQGLGVIPTAIGAVAAAGLVVSAALAWQPRPVAQPSPEQPL